MSTVGLSVIAGAGFLFGLVALLLGGGLYGFGYAGLVVGPVLLVGLLRRRR